MNPMMLVIYLSLCIIRYKRISFLTNIKIKLLVYMPMKEEMKKPKLKMKTMPKMQIMKRKKIRKRKKVKVIRL